MTTFSNTYQNYKLSAKATIPGSLSSFLYVYCKTLNCPDSEEPAFTRKAVSFNDLAKYVRLHLTNDFDLWYRKNEDSPVLLEVLSNIINTKDGRTRAYFPAQPFGQPSNKTEAFMLPGFPMPIVLVQKYS
jgi:hypothetical protein